MNGPPDEVLLASARTVLKTSSGKIRRAACRVLYEKGLLQSQRRVVWPQLARLVRDAAAGVSLLAGEGTGLGMTEAYMLAGELRACGNDHVSAFTRYEAGMMQFLKRKQKSAARFASAFAPKSAAGIAIRNLVTRLMRIPFVADQLIGHDLRDDLTVPDYGFQSGIERPMGVAIPAPKLSRGSTRSA